MARVKHAQHKGQPHHHHHRHEKNAQVGIANRNRTPQDELFVPYSDQEHTGKQQNYTSQHASRTQTSATPHTPRTHNMRKLTGSNSQTPRPRGAPKGPSPYRGRTKGHPQRASKYYGNYRSAGVPMDVAVEGNRSERRSVAPQSDNNQKQATGYTEKSDFPQETGDPYFEQPTAHTHTGWDDHSDNHQEVASWVDAAVTAIDDGLEDEIMFRKMQKRLSHMIDELKGMWKTLNGRSPYHKAKAAAHQMMEENSDDHEGMRVVSRKLDDAVRELGRV